ncbi:hypothetical protein MASR2M70_07590 [Bacillota bacterium]
MWMDVVVSLIFIVSTVVGFRQGFVRTLVHALGWALSIALGFAFHSLAYGLLRSNTGYYEMIHARIIERIDLEGPSAAGSFVTDMPAIIQEFIEPIKNSVASAIASGVADFIFKILSFTILVVLIRIIFLLFSFFFSKKSNRGLIGFLDGIMGFIAGMVKGILLIFLLLALLMPVLGLSSGDFFAEALDSSRIAGVLYDNNYLLLIIRGIFL